LNERKDDRGEGGGLKGREGTEKRRGGRREKDEKGAEGKRREEEGRE